MIWMIVVAIRARREIEEEDSNETRIASMTPTIWLNGKCLNTFKKAPAMSAIFIEDEVWKKKDRIFEHYIVI